MTVPYLLRFCPCRALMYVVWYSYPGCRFACPGLCACWAFSPCIIGCTSAIQASLIAFGLCDNSARPCLNQKLILSHGCVESQSTRPEGTEVHSPAASEATPWAKEIIGLSARFVCLYCALCERLGAIGGTGAPVGGLAAHLQFEHAAAHDVVVEEVRLGVAASVELGPLHIDVLSAVVEGPYGEALAVGEL